MSGRFPPALPWEVFEHTIPSLSPLQPHPCSAFLLGRAKNADNTWLLNSAALLVQDLTLQGKSPQCKTSFSK